MQTRLIGAAAAAALGAVLALVPTARAAILESEPNDTLATADVIARVPGVNFADVGVPGLAAPAARGDVDVFSIELLAGEILTAVTTPLTPPAFDIPDTEMVVVSPDGTILEYNDDAGLDSGADDGRGSLVRWQALETGTYYVAVTGFDDVFADSDAVGEPFAVHVNGTHAQTGAYALTVSVVQIPEPASASAAVALAGLGTIVRRRRRTI